MYAVKTLLLRTALQGFIQPPRRGGSTPHETNVPPRCGRTINSPLREGVPVL